MNFKEVESSRKRQLEELIIPGAIVLLLFGLAGFIAKHLVRYFILLELVGGL